VKVDPRRIPGDHDIFISGNQHSARHRDLSDAVAAGCPRDWRLQRQGHPDVRALLINQAQQQARSRHEP